MKHKITGSVELTRTPIKYHEDCTSGDETLLIFKLNQYHTALNLAVNFGSLETKRGVVELLPEIIELGIKAYNEKIELEQRDSYFNVYCENCHLRHEELKASDGAVNIEDQTITFICHQKACSAKMTVPLKPQIIN